MKGEVVPRRRPPIEGAASATPRCLNRSSADKPVRSLDAVGMLASPPR
jgi:hypothetical protein